MQKYTLEHCHFICTWLYFLIQWKEDIQDKPKLCTYVKLKDSFDVEYYVALNLTRQQRSILAQLRCGILPINIETGRLRSIKRENRICTMCNMEEVEDELHFIFNCPFYNDLRYNFLNNVPFSCNNHSLAECFNILCEIHPRNLSKFINEILIKCKSSMHAIMQC